MKWLCVLFSSLFVYFITACQPSSIIESFIPSGQVLYQDDFSDPYSGWLNQAGPFGAADYFESGFRIWVNSSDYDLWTNPSLNFNDVRVEVDAARIEGPESNRYGLICRYRDQQGFYFFVISSDGYYAIGKSDHGNYSLIGQSMMAYNENIHLGDVPNHLRADCVGDILTFFINDKQVAVASDPDFKSGDVGLLAGTFSEPGTDVLFDNLVVLKP